MFSNKTYIDLMAAVCAIHKSLGQQSFTFFVNSASPETGLYMQHVLNSFKGFKSFFMAIQTYDQSYTFSGDHLTKQPRCAFLILRSIKPQDTTDHKQALEDCEIIAEEVIAYLYKYCAQRRNSKIEYNMDLSQVSMEAVSITGDNKAGVRCDFSLNIASTPSLKLDPARWTDLTSVGITPGP